MQPGQISVISFGGGFNLPLWAAQAQGLFARHGVDIVLHFTVDSRQVFRGLMQDDYHVAITAFDNIVAHQAGHADPVGDAATDFFAFMGSDDGFLSLVGAPDVPDFAALAGRAVTVDDPANGFSMVLREMLARHGLSADDVRWERAGGTDRRYAALLEGRHGATMLRTPFDLMALRQGCHLLASTRETVGRYMGIVGAARRSWAAAHAATLVGFIRAYRDAIQWLKAPPNRPAALALLMAHVPGMSAEVAAMSCDAMLDANGGFFDDVRLDPEGARAVLDLRAKFRALSPPFDSPGSHIDERYWRAA